MYALHLKTMSGWTHTLFFKSRTERAHFMSDPIVFVTSVSYQVPIESERTHRELGMCDPSSQVEEMMEYPERFPHS